MTYISGFSDLTNLCRISGLALFHRSYKSQSYETWSMFTSDRGKMNTGFSHLRQVYLLFLMNDKLFRLTSILWQSTDRQDTTFCGILVFFFKAQTGETPHSTEFLFFFCFLCLWRNFGWHIKIAPSVCQSIRPLQVVSVRPSFSPSVCYKSCLSDIS